MEILDPMRGKRPRHGPGGDGINLETTGRPESSGFEVL